MNINQVLDTYDQQYAREYDDTFLRAEWAKNSVAFQLEVVKGLLAEARNWLDVACGTGFFLSHFPEIERAGLDMSPAMLQFARKKNQGVDFCQGNFFDEFPQWEGKWDLVSCMWWAYCLVESMAQVERLIGNLARWTSDRGKCFFPLCNPRKFDTESIKTPYYVDSDVPGRVIITGIIWTWIQQNGKRHDSMVSPQIEHVAEMFAQHFTSVEIVEGPLDAIGEGWRVQDVLIASGKRPKRS